MPSDADQVLQNAVSELIARNIEQFESGTKVCPAIDKWLRLAIGSCPRSRNNAGVGDRHTNGSRGWDTAFYDPKANEDVLHIRYLGDVGHPAPQVKIIRCPQAGA